MVRRGAVAVLTIVAALQCPGHVLRNHNYRQRLLCETYQRTIVAVHRVIKLVCRGTRGRARQFAVWLAWRTTDQHVQSFGLWQDAMAVPGLLSHATATLSIGDGGVEVRCQTIIRLNEPVRLPLRVCHDHCRDRNVADLTTQSHTITNKRFTLPK